MNMDNRSRITPSLGHAPSTLAALLIAGLLVALNLGPPAQAGETKAPAGLRVNINSASVEQLQELPGVGAARAEAIVKLREQRGGFRSVEELLEIKGIGESGLKKIAPHVVLKGESHLP